MTDTEVNVRLNELKSTLCNESLVRSLYGHDVLTEQAFGWWAAWARRASRPRQTQVDERFHRANLETFFQQEEILPLPWAAARLGMTLTSFNEVVDWLDERGALPKWAKITDLASERFIREFPSLFPALQNRVFHNHDDFCRRVHDVIRAEKPSFSIEPLLCATKDNGTDDHFAYGFDSVTDEPLCLRHTLWLETGKPMNLRPDVCSKKTLETHRSQIEPNLFPGVSAEATPTNHP